jgi:hypothetical protein
MVGAAGPEAWTTPTSGHLAIVQDQIWVYGENGVYRLNPDTLSADLAYALPKGYIERGDMIALPGGGVLLAHWDVSDRRLIALNADGTSRWGRSSRHFVHGRAQRLLLLNGRPYLVSQRNASGAIEISLFEIDVSRPGLTRLFTASGQSFLSDDTWVSAIGDGREPSSASTFGRDESNADGFLLNVGSGVIVALDTQLAREIILQGSNPQ